MLLLASRSATAHRLLALAVGETFGLANLPLMERGLCGKPFFPDCPHIRFSLSHSGPYALCAVAGEEVGVDIEQLRPRSARLPRAVLTHREYTWYEANGASWEAFYTLWTRKESLCKREGRGVVQPLKICPPLPEESCKGISLSTFAGPGWCAAVCSIEPVPPIRWVIC